MKHFYITILVVLLGLTTQGQDLILTGVYDGNLTGGTPKAIEVYVVNDIPDLSLYGIGSANNGGGTDGNEFSFEGMANAGDYIYVASEEDNFTAFFGFAPTFVNSVAGINGDDAVELYNGDNVIDTFGEIDVDGTGTAWEYADGWAYRTSDTGPDGEDFIIANWTFSGINENDDDIDSQANATNPWPLGSFTIDNSSSEPFISFEESLTQTTENAGEVTIDVSITESADATVEVVLVYTTDEASSFSIPTNIAFIAGGDTTVSLTVDITDNDQTNNDYLVAIELQNPTGATLSEDYTHTLYVLDNESHAPTAANVLDIQFSNNLEVNGAEIVTYDAGTERLFISNSGDTAVEIVDFSNPSNLTFLSTVVLNNFGAEVTSVSAYEGLVAVAVRAEDTANGTVVFIDTDGNILSNVEVGSLPDMLTFTPDGTKVLVANEGEPNDDYDIDPEGTISIIDLTNGAENITQDDVTSLNFNEFDASQETLTTSGVRIFGPGASVSQDLEPEYITITEDSTTAYVSLQENNAYAIVDIETSTITAIEPYGFKDHSLTENAFDVSNRIDFIFMSSWNTLGMYQPDAIANYDVNGTNYIVMANEGDARDYDGFSEEDRVGDLDLDPTAYPNADIIQLDENLGRLTVSTAIGDTDGDGDIDQIYSYGARSFSILDTTTGEIVYDSGDILERIIKEDPIYGAIFNATDDENTFKNRSDDKGPEPEAVTVAQINDNWYAFIGLERIGGVAIFNITDPTSPIFETYVNNRDTTLDVENPDGDLAPEGIIYIAPEDNATENGYIVVANEVSSTVSVYAINNDILSTESFTLANTTTAYPNPVQSGNIYFSKITDVTIVDLLGRVISQESQVSKTSLDQLKDGIYILQFSDGSTQKIIKN